MQCEICGKEVKPQGMKAHIRMAHPDAGRDIEQEPVVKELQDKVGVYESKIATLTGEIATLKAYATSDSKGKSVEDIARILYEDVVKPLCSERGIPVGEWEEIDQSDYLTVARKIKG